MGTEKNVKLKAALFKQDITQRELSRKTGIPEAYLSLAVNGRYVLDKKQREQIAKILGVDGREVFDC